MLLFKVRYTVTAYKLVGVLDSNLRYVRRWKKYLSIKCLKKRQALNHIRSLASRPEVKATLKKEG